MCFNYGVKRKKDIARKLAQARGFRQDEALEIVRMVIKEVEDGIVQDGGIQLRNFGTFLVKLRKARVGRNPRTREEVLIPRRKTVVFKPSPKLRERLGPVEGEEG